MSFISDGIDDYDGESDAMGFIRYGVGEVRRQVVAAKDLIDKLDKKMFKASGKPRAQWESFKQQWDSFYQSTQGTEGAFNQFKDSTYERTLGFQQRAEALSAALATAKKSDLTTPLDSAQQKSSQTSISLPSFNPNIGFDVPWKKILLWGSISAGGIWIGHKVYKHYTSPVRKVAALATGQTQEELPPQE